MITSIKGTLSTCKMEILGLVSKLRSVDSVILMINVIIFFVEKKEENIIIIQGVFFNWAYPLDWPPPKNASTGPPLNLVSMRITLRSSDT